MGVRGCRGAPLKKDPNFYVQMCTFLHAFDLQILL